MIIIDNSFHCLFIVTFTAYLHCIFVCSQYCEADAFGMAE